MILLILFLALIIYKSRFTSDGFSTCLSEETTKGVRGICTLMVILHHLAQCFTSHMLFREMFSRVGFMAVAVFFFYSGYGLIKSYQTKADYTKTFLVKRFGSILVSFAAIILLYWLASFLLGNGYTPVQVLFLFYTGYPIVTDSWYIIVILLFYFSFYLFMRIFKRRYYLIMIATFLWCIAWVLLARRLNYASYWYNTVICIWFGVLAALYESKLVDLLKKRYVLLWPTALLLFGGCFVLIFGKFFVPSALLKLILMYLCEAAFLLIVLLLTSKFRANNKIWKFLSGISLEVYLCHRLFMNFLRSQYISIDNDLVWAFLVIGLAVAFSYVLHQLFSKINHSIQHFLLPRNHR